MRIEELMRRDVVMIGPGESCLDAVVRMQRARVRHLPVVNREGRLVGIVTDRDLRHAALAPALDEYLSVRAHRRARQMSETLENLQVKDVMTWAVVTTGPEAPLTYGALIMFERRVGSLPVLERGRLVGMLTERDVLRALLLEGKVAEFGGGYLW